MGMHLEVKVEEVLWEVLEAVEAVVQVQEDLAQVQVEVQWEAQEAAAQAQEDQGQVQEEVPWEDRVDHLVAKEVSWMHLEVKVEEVLWEVLVAVEAVAQALAAVAQVQEDLGQAQEG